jgi:hypothetical protein
MRPDWHACNKCYFMLIGSDGTLYCHYDPYPLETVENSFCSRWICSNCGGDWCDEISHSNCMDITVELS